MVGDTTQTPGPIREGFEEIYTRSLDCVHCGLCLPTCPTYVETGREISSPRGRIYLMRGVAEGRIPLADAVAEEAYLCLGCRACETACPSGVRYGSMLERLRHEVVTEGGRGRFARSLQRCGTTWRSAKRSRLRAKLPRTPSFTTSWRSRSSIEP